jgi:hypothetical protein
MSLDIVYITNSKKGVYGMKDKKIYHHHHQPINVPTAGAQAFLMNYPQGERGITHTHHAAQSGLVSA